MITPASVVDLIVTTRNPALLDQTIQSLPMCTALVVDESFDGATARVRVFSGLGFLKFAMERQGYGTVIAEEIIS